MPIAFQSVLMRRSVLERVGGFDATRDVTSDWSLLLLVGLKCRMEYLPGIAGKFRYHPNSHSMTRQLSWATRVPRMYEDFFTRNDLPEEIQVLKKESLANAHLYSAYILLDRAPLRATVQELFRALTIYPLLLSSRRLGKLALLCAVGPWGRALWRCVAKRKPQLAEGKK